MTALQLDRVTKRFEDVRAVNEVSFSVDRGEIVSLLGPSGCGKTTTLRVIAGFEQPDAGRILIGDEEMGRRRPYERNVGLVFQDYALFPHMTVAENIGYGLRRRGLRGKAVANRVREMLELVKLGAYGQRRPGQLSGGQRQRVALARALATSPEVMLLDEPLSALDAKMRQHLRLELKSILRTVGTTAVIVTHDQEEAMSMAERVVVMSEGEIAQIGTPTEIYAEPQTRFVAEFIGRSNWFQGELSKGVVAGKARFLGEDGSEFFVAAGPDLPLGACEVCVRPEQVQVLDSSSDAGSRNVVRGTVVEAAHSVAELHLLVRSERGTVLSIVQQYRGQQLPNIGETICAAFSHEDCLTVPREQSASNASL